MSHGETVILHATEQMEHYVHVLDHAIEQMEHYMCSVGLFL